MAAPQRPFIRDYRLLWCSANKVKVNCPNPKTILTCGNLMISPSIEYSRCYLLFIIYLFTSASNLYMSFQSLFVTFWFDCRKIIWPNLQNHDLTNGKAESFWKQRKLTNERGVHPTPDHIFVYIV